MSAPPPAYHVETAVSIDESTGHPVQPLPPPASGEPGPTRSVRCPTCSVTFEWTTRRPTQVACPACGAKGRLR